MPQSVGSIMLNLGLNTAPLSTQIKTASAGAQTQLNGAFKGVSAQASKAAGGIGAKFSGLFAKLGGMMAAAFALGRIKAMVSEWQSLYRTQLESEIKISVTMRNATNATMEQIQAVKDLASHYQQLGVIGDEVQLAGMQELATYVKEVESVKKLMPVLNDMVAQQYGYDATGGSAVGIATMLGKVMNGSTTALSRYGYDFTDEQANIIKYGTEAEKVATVTEVIEASVANMNEALAQTPTGKAKQLSNNFGDLKESLGSLTINLCAPFISMLNVIVVKLTQAFNALSRFTAALLHIKSFSFAGLGKGAQEASGSIDGIAKSAGGAGKAISKSLMGFDQLNRLDSHDSGGGSGESDEDSLPFSGQDMEELNEFAAKVKYIQSLFAEGFKFGFASADLKAIRQHAESVRQSLKAIFASKEVQDASKSFSDALIKNLGKITGAIGSVGATLAENLLGGMDIFLQKHGESLKSRITELFDIRTEIANTAGDLFAAFGEIFSAWKSEGGKKITAAVLSVFTDMNLHITATLSKVGRDAFGALAKPFIENAVSMKATAEQVLKPIGEIFSVIADYYHEMCGVFQVGYDRFVKPIFDALGDALSKLWQSHLQPMWSKIAGFLGKLAALLKSVFGKLQPFMPVLKSLLAVLGKLFAPLAKIIGSEIMSGFGRLADAIGMIFDVLSGLLDFIVGVFTGDWDRAWNGIKNTVSAVWNWLKSSLSPIGSMFSGLWQSLKNGASDAWDRLKNGAASAWEGIKSVFSTVASFFQNTFHTAWEKVKSVFSTGGQIFSGIKDGIVSAFKSIVNKIISGINTVVAVPFKGINSMLSKIRGVSILGYKPFSGIGSVSVPNIPMLAQGGYVKANTPQLAMIGDNRRYGEIVAPENKMLEMILTALKLFNQQNPPSKPQNNDNQLIELVVNLGDETLMRRIIKCFDALFSPSRTMTAKAAMTLPDGTVIRLTAADFKSGGVKLSEATSTSGSFDLGAAVIGKLTLKLNNADGRFNGVSFIGGQVSSVQIGVILPPPDNSTEWIPLGVFDIDSVKYSGTAAEIVAYDFLSRADKALPAVACPVTLGNLVRSICTHCGIIWSGQSFLNDDYTVNSLPAQATCRDVISYAAALAGCYAKMNREGQLTFGWYGWDMPLWGTEALLDGGIFLNAASGDEANGGDFLHYDDDSIDGGRNDFRGGCVVSNPKRIAGDKPITVTGILYHSPDSQQSSVDENGNEIVETVPGNSYICGTDDYAFDLSDNPLLTHDVPGVLAALGEKLIGESFSPISLSCTSNPAFEAGDIVTVTDRRGNTYRAYVNRCEYKFGSAQNLSCEAKTPSEKSAERYSVVSRLEQKLKKDADAKISAYGTRLQALNNLMLNSMGVYKTAVQNPDGSVTHYTHDKPTLAASSYIACETANGFAYTNSGWNEGSPVWQYGMTADGNIICNVLSAVGIVADWIQAGRIESADGSCYFDLDNNQLFANKIGLSTRYLSAGEVSTDTGESRAGIACYDSELSSHPYIQIRPVQAQSDAALMGYGLADQLGRIQLLCAARADQLQNNAVAIYGYDSSGDRHEMLVISAANGGIKLTSMNGQNRIQITNNGISVYKNNTLVQSW